VSARLGIGLVLALIACLAIGPPQALGAERAPYIVVLKDGIDSPGAVARDQTEQRNGDLGFVYRYALKGYSATLPKAAVAALERDPRVDFVSPDRKVELFSQSTPTGIKRIFATENPNIDVDEVDDVRIDADVAVIDTGVFEHTDLSISKLTNCVPPKKLEEPNVKECKDGSATDEDGHGTHVAGTIGAIDNKEWVVGVAPGARIWGVKVFTLNAKNKSAGSESWTAAGIDWVTGRYKDIEVANMSLGCGGEENEKKEIEECTMKVVETAITGSIEKGIVYVVAAGNETVDAGKYVSPAKHPEVITVSALADYDGEPGGATEWTCEDEGKDDTLATFSNFGKAVDVAAPGACILSTSSAGGLELSSGTSMAAPHVAGAAAILASVSNPNSKSDVKLVHQDIVDAGNFDWEDISEDGELEPLLDVGVPGEHGLWLINGASLTAGSETITGGQEGTSIFKVHVLGIGIVCEKGTLTEGKIEALGLGSATLSFTECGVSNPELGAEIIETCDVKDIVRKVSLLLLQRGGAVFALVKPAIGEEFAKIAITGELCPAAEIEGTLSGSFAVKIRPTAVKQSLLSVEGPQLKKALGVSLQFGEETADFHFSGYATLSGKETGKVWGVH
jgi:subtilisin family serine protease